jgi:hypothetical protein
VDRNKLAVELAKLSLWLHSFTVGAPLSFLDHHLRHGDSLFGAWVSDTEATTSGAGNARAGGMTLHHAIANARGAAAGMAHIEELADADIAQVRESAKTFEIVEEATAPLRAFLDCWHALLWLSPVSDLVPAGDRKERAAQIRQAEQERRVTINAWLDGGYGDPVELACGATPKGIPRTARDIAALLNQLRAIAQRQHLLHWQPAFPGVWAEWSGLDVRGGFDAVIGNPPWVRQESIHAMKNVLKERYRTYEGKADLYTFFLEPRPVPRGRCFSLCAGGPPARTGRGDAGECECCRDLRRSGGSGETDLDRNGPAIPNAAPLIRSIRLGSGAAGCAGADGTDPAGEPISVQLHRRGSSIWNQDRPQRGLPCRYDNERRSHQWRGCA